MSRNARASWERWVWSLSTVVVLVAAALAHGTLGQPFPSLFVDPFGSVSEVALPGWPVADAPLPRFPDRLVAVDGAELDVRAQEIPAVLRQRVAAHLARGQGKIALTFRAADGRRYEVWATIRSIGVIEVTYFFWLYAGIGVFLLWSGLQVVSMQGARSGGKAYGLCAVGGFLFLVTFFDYHTTGLLAPLFGLGTILSALGFFALAFGFPAPPVFTLHGERPRIVRGIGALLIVVAVLAWGWLVAARGLNLEVVWLRLLLTMAAPLGAATLVACTLARLVAGTPAARRELTSVVVAILVVPALLAAGFMLPSSSGLRRIHLVMPFALFFVPLSIGYALVRRNILETARTIPRQILLVPAATSAWLGALVAWLALFEQMSPQGGMGAAAAIAGLLGIFAGLLVHRALLKGLFPARSSFRPMIVALAEKLSELRDAAPMRRVITDVVTEWMDARSVQLLDVGALPDIAASADAAALAAGQTAWTSGTPRERALLVPLRALGEVRGVLVIGPKRGGGLYEDQDLALLQTVGTLGATALQHAEALAEVEALRQLEVESTRDEKKMALGLLAAEMSHEIAYPLNFFRFLLGQARKRQALDTQDIDIGREEVERLERMLSALRRLQVPRQSHVAVRLIQIVERAGSLLQELLAGRCLCVEVDAGTEVIADPDSLLQLLANLLRNAVQATPVVGSVGIRACDSDDGLVLEVWDEGPGVSPEIEASLFSPWVTRREGGVGLGLAISYRIARSFGWTLAHKRDAGRGQTCFQVRIPKASLVDRRQGTNE